LLKDPKSAGCVRHPDTEELYRSSRGASDSPPRDTKPRTELTAREIVVEQEVMGQRFGPFSTYRRHVEPPGRVTSGRHRKLSETPSVVVLRVAAAFVVVGLATVAGVASFHGPTQRSSIAAATPLQGAPAVADLSRKINAPIGPRAAAYVDALKRENIPVVDVSTLLLVAGSVCARQGDVSVPAQAERLMAAFPGRWSPQQAAVIVDRAIELVCGDNALHGANVSVGVYPAK
jgi:hypothetical protein